MKSAKSQSARMSGITKLDSLAGARGFVPFFRTASINPDSRIPSRTAILTIKYVKYMPIIAVTKENEAQKIVDRIISASSVCMYMSVPRVALNRSFFGDAA